VSAQLTSNAQNSRHKPRNPRHDGPSNLRLAQHRSPSDLMLKEYGDKHVPVGVGIRVDWIALVTRFDELGQIGRDRDRGDGASHSAVSLCCRADRRERCIGIGVGDARAGRWNGHDVKRGRGQVVELGADADADRCRRADSGHIVSVDRTGIARQERGYVQ